MVDGWSTNKSTKKLKTRKINSNKEKADFWLVDISTLENSILTKNQFGLYGTKNFESSTKIKAWLDWLISQFSKVDNK